MKTNKEVESGAFVRGFNDGVEAEKKAWLEGRRCYECGKGKGRGLASMCGQCFEEK